MSYVEINGKTMDHVNEGKEEIQAEKRGHM